ncbi:hypothetical protein EPO44_16885 [bacterium]|nr:MAG: hypothetical protein EPO44_16885 [bacterium]
MNFVYPELESLSLAKSAEIVHALGKLCGEEIRVSPQQAQRLEAALRSIGSLGYEELNEILLIAGQDRVSKAFFEYFFGGQATADSPRLKLRNGIINPNPTFF